MTTENEPAVPQAPTPATPATPAVSNGDNFVRPPSNLFFPLTAVFGVAFVITIFALVARMFGNPRAPINRFLDEYGMHLILTEVIGILLSGLLAMVVDRLQTLARTEEK